MSVAGKLYTEIWPRCV